MIKVTKHTEQKQVEVIDKEEYFCDLCGGEIHTRAYSRDNFRVKFSKGYGYPESGNVVTDQAYFCELCSDIVKSTLEKIGVKFEQEERDW